MGCAITKINKPSFELALRKLLSNGLSDDNKLLKDVSSFLENGTSKESLIEKRDVLLCAKINLSDFMLWLFENYPNSIEQYKNKQDELLIKQKKMRPSYMEYR